MNDINADVGKKTLSQLPKTYAQRGLFLGLTTPMLAEVRFRIEDPSHPDALLPAMGGQGLYIIPFKALNSVTPLTVHDRMMHERITKEEPVTPLAMRSIRLQVEKTGVAGVEAGKRAKKELESDQEHALAATIALIQKTVNQFGDQAALDGPITTQTLASESGQRAIRSAMQGFAQGVNAQPGQVVDWMLEMSRTILPLSTPDHDGTHGFLSRTMQEMAAFAEDLDNWSRSEPAKAAHLSQQLVLATHNTLDHARKYSRRIEKATTELKTLLSNWEKARGQMAELVTKVSWVLDGWDRNVLTWNRVIRARRWEQRSAAQNIMRNLPILPLEELAKNEEDILLWRKLKIATSRSHEFLSDEEVDMEVVQKLEQYRSEQA